MKVNLNIGIVNYLFEIIKLLKQFFTDTLLVVGYPEFKGGLI